ncbi:MAG: restriction endonuclease [Pseudomonadota bacterium]|nr:restriction endonuclease [Pseudomonadota bacterium]
MLTAPLIGTALVIATVLGSSITAYLWLVRKRQIETRIGIQALAAMRWREFSHFVVEALRDRGFELNVEAPQPQKGEQADLQLLLNDKTWLLGCRQGADQVMSASQVADLARAVRHTGSIGGILATLGKIEPAAGAVSQDVELIDGVSLWSLIQPLLPESLQEHLAGRARHDTLRSIELAWVGAILVGFALALAMKPESSAPEAAPVDATTSAPAPTPAGVTERDEVPNAVLNASVSAPTVPAAPAAGPGTEEQRRDEVRRAVSTLQGVEKAAWSSRSTLVVYLQSAEADEELVSRLCSTIEAYDELRASRLQLQPPAGTDKSVRFRQCHVY